MALREEFGAKDSGERLKLVFDFTSELASGETLSTATVASGVYSGADANPAAMISEAASISGPQVTQFVIGGVAGVVYLLTCTVTTSAGQTLKGFGLLALV